MFKPVESKINFPELEVQILKFWQENKIFEKSVENRRGQDRFVFYEGPPTANGKPGSHHILARSYKDIICRYQTMKGKLVERKGGWDTHGLPVEIEVEKKLGIQGQGKQGILTLKRTEEESIEYFNQLCRESVFEYVDLWKKTTERIGFWIDMDQPYVTLDNSYIESVWNIIKQINDQNLLYESYKVVPFCPRCGTPLSSHELAQGYKDNVPDPSVYIKFELVDEPGTYLLVWTTTPWTLPGNVALALGKNIDYVKVKLINGDNLILAKKRLSVLDGPYEIVGKVTSQELLNQNYQPLYPYLREELKKKNMKERGWYITEAAFASDEDGTGIVHTAVMYGVDDFELGKKIGLPLLHTVDQEGRFNNFVEPFKGQFVKAADKNIIADLQERGLLYRSEPIKHTYPFCWRCSTPVVYYAINSWFIKTTAIKDRLIENNSRINWVPTYVKSGRMGNFFESLIDWSLSRNRFWGTPLPVWKCANNHIKVIGSIKDLEELRVKVPSDLHRPYIDKIEFKCSECQQLMKREPYVMDVWLDSGAMPYAQWHYPFENQEVFKEWFPADYIVEGMDQTRGWFFTLISLAGLLGYEGAYPAKNILSHGLVLDASGQKMSKSKGNVVDPWEVIDHVGADAMRWYFFSCTAAGSDYRFSVDLVKDSQRRFMLIWWNVFKFFLDYASVDKWDCRLSSPQVREQLSALDSWVLSELTKLVVDVNKNLDKLNVSEASRLLEDFTVNKLSTWYLRRSRSRFGPTAKEEQKTVAYSVLYGVLVTLSKLSAPFVPFIAEFMYRQLVVAQNQSEAPSVHLADFPVGDNNLLNPTLVKQMDIVRNLAEQGLAQRKENAIKIRQPLGGKTFYQLTKQLPAELETILKDELNLEDLEYRYGGESLLKLDLNITSDLRQKGEVRDLIRAIQEKRKELGTRLDDRIRVMLPSLPEDKVLIEQIKKETLATELKVGTELKIDVVS